MSPTNEGVWYRHPGTSFYILANSVSSPRLYVQPSYYNQSQLVNYAEQRGTIEKVEETEEGYYGDGELDDSFLDVSSGETAMDSVDELKSYEKKEAHGNGELDALEYSPISIVSWLSNGIKELAAENLGRVNGEARGEVDAGEDGAVVGDVMEDEHPVDLQLEASDKIGTGPELWKGQQCAKDPSEASSSKKMAIGEKNQKMGRDGALDKWPKKVSLIS